MLRKRGNTYHVQFRDLSGRVNTMTLRTGDRAKAEVLERAFMTQLRSRKTAAAMLRKFPEMGNRTQNVQLQQLPPSALHKRGGMALSAMLDYARSRRPLSADHASAWQHFCDNVPAKFADQITPQIAQAYLDEHFGAKKAKTFNNHKTMLNTVFRCCLVQAGLSASPFASIINRSLTDVESHRNLTQQELDAVMSAGDVQIRTMVMLARWTGQRLETCARIRWQDIDAERRVFLIMPGKTARFKKFVAVPIFQPLADYLTAIRPPDVDPEQPIIATVSNWKTPDYFSKRFSQLLGRLNITDPRACFHSLRGNFITWLKDQNVPAEVRQSITGHSSLSIEDIYSESVNMVSAIAKKTATSTIKTCMAKCMAKSEFNLK